MKKVYIYKVLFIIGFVLLGCFILSSVYDSYHYIFGSWKYGSAPLDLYIAIRALEFLLPAIISFVIAYILKVKSRKKDT